VPGTSSPSPPFIASGRPPVLRLPGAIAVASARRAITFWFCTGTAFHAAAAWRICPAQAVLVLRHWFMVLRGAAFYACCIRWFFKGSGGTCAALHRRLRLQARGRVVAAPYLGACVTIVGLLDTMPSAFSACPAFSEKCTAWQHSVKRSTSVSTFCLCSSYAGRAALGMPAASCLLQSCKAPPATFASNGYYLASALSPAALRSWHAPGPLSPGA